MNPERFPDKKDRNNNGLFDEAARILKEARHLEEKRDIGQREATWIPGLEYPNQPLMLMLMTDTHFGSTKTNIELLQEHLDILANTPNFYMVHNGDDVDNFNATGKWASGMMENPLPPQTASRAWCEAMGYLDTKGKIGVMSFGNHNDFGWKAGQDWYDSFLSEMECPIFTTGGLLHIMSGAQRYDLALTHMYWGVSKLNPTNATKRFLEHEYPMADILFLGHTHQSEGLHFERGGKDRVAVIGGTYKDSDTYARKRGISGRSGSPGWVVALWPNERRLQLFKDVNVARDFLLNSILAAETGGYEDPYSELIRRLNEQRDSRSSE